MYKKPSILTRIAVGKLVGLFFGLFGFVMLPYFMPEASMMFRSAILLWYISLGAIIGVFGVMTYHPDLDLPLPWWLRSALIGGWMNFVLSLFVYDLVAPMAEAMFGKESMFNSPFWLIFEGAFIGLIMGYFATRFGGEGKAAVDQ
jgi:hypothetical protein